MLAELLTVTLFGYTWIFIIFVGFYLGGLFYAENVKEGRVSLFFTLVLLALMYFFGSGYESLSIKEYFTWGNIFIYLTIGIFYSLFRIYLLSKNYRKAKSEKHEDALESIKKKATKNFMRWVIQFPISLLAFVCTDLLSDLFTKITNFFSGIIDSILALGVRHNETMKPVTEDSSVVSKSKSQND